MGYMHFTDETLEKIFKSYKWTRNNTIEIFEAALAQDILAFTPQSQRQKLHKFQPIIFQFQCIVSTTDAYYRRLIGHKNQNYGILVEGEEILPKKDIPQERILSILSKQLATLQKLLSGFTNKQTIAQIHNIMAINSHEYLHQGELILMFREDGASLPERYVKAWAL